jgi:hypothetical protein
MKQFIRLTAVTVLVLMLGMSALTAQEVTFSAGPAVSPTTGAQNGGFFWGDVNGDGYLDVFIASNNILLNNGGTTFAPASTMTASITVNANSVGGLLADFNGDGVLDLWSTNGANPQTGLYYNTAGVFVPAGAAGQLSAAPGNGQVFEGMAVAPIDHTNYLSAVWAGPDAATGAYPGDGNNFSPGSGIVLMKGSAAGFTKIGIQRGSAPATVAILQSFDSVAVGTAFNHIGWSSTDIQAIDSLDPLGGTNKCLKNSIHNYNAAPVLAFALPAGKTLSDYNTFSFKVFWAQGDVAYKTITVEAYQTLPTGHAFSNTADTIGTWADGQSAASTVWQNVTIPIANNRSFSGTVYIAFGINCSGTGSIPTAGTGTVWYADDVTLSSTGSGSVSAGTAAIDTSLAFESWDPRFFDANNDGYQDLLMPSIRHGFARIDTGTSGARKGCVMFMNDGTGNFVVPTATSLGRTIYSVGASGASTTGDTGIIVDDTVRHFSAIGCQFGDLNNDGIDDLFLNGLVATDNIDGNGAFVADVILYGKGDGTFTYKWDGTHVVAKNGIVQATGQRSICIGDYNNDGLPDILTSETFSPQHLYRNNGNGTFTDVASQNGLTAGGAQRSDQFVDYNNDGFLDTYIYTGGNSVLLKNGGNSNHWIAFKPIGTGHNMSAIGARFTLYTQGGTFKQIRDIIAAGGSAGQGAGSRANFGIGINTSIDSVVVKWPDGTRSSYSGLAVDKYWTIKEGSAIPNATALVYPANAATSAAVTDTLKWNKATSALGYSVQVSMDPTFANAALMAVNKSVTDTTYAYSLGAATKYYWRVAAVNGGFTSAYTPANNFTTAGAAAAAVPTVLTPTSGAINQAAALTLKVGKTSDASRYQWQVSILSSFNTFVVNDSTADTTYAAKLTGGLTYYMRARGMNDLGASAYSAVDTFSVMAVPARPTLATPANNLQNVVSDSVWFTWSKISNASSYDLKLMTVSSTKQYSTTDTAYKVTGLAKLTNYTWQVQANNIGGSSGYTGASAFTTVIAAPAAPTLVSPRSTTTENRLTKFVWNTSANATKYRVQVATDNAFATVVRDTTVAFDTTVTLANHLDSETPYFWRVAGINAGGLGAYATAVTFTTGTVDAVGKAANVIPKSFALMQNYPNPFNPTTTITYDIPKSAFVSLKIYDVLGRLVTTLVDGIQEANSYRLQWNPTGLSSGVYFYRIQARSQDGSQNFTSVKKLVFMK